MKILKMNQSSRQGYQDDNLRKTLDSYSVLPPEHIWGNIEANLDKDKSRRGILFFVLPLAFLMAVGGGAWWYASQQKHSGNMVAIHSDNIALQNVQTNIADNTFKNKNKIAFASNSVPSVQNAIKNATLATSPNTSSINTSSTQISSKNTGSYASIQNTPKYKITKHNLLNNNDNNLNKDIQTSVAGNKIMEQTPRFPQNQAMTKLPPPRR